VLYSLQDHLKTGTRDLAHPVVVGAENTDNWHARKVDLQRAFPLDVPMVPSSGITVMVDGEHLICSGFTHGETIRLGNFEFIIDYFSALSLSLKRGHSSTTFIGSTHSGA
jgi:hypothetical protein